MYRFKDGPILLRTIGSYLNILQFYLFNWYSGANFAITRSIFKASGGFDTSLTLSEDTDLGRKLKKYGEVKRDLFFLVETSGRRFYKGILVGLFIYTITYLKIKLAENKNEIQFIPIRNSADLRRFNFIPATFMAFVIFVAAIFIVPVSPVHAKAQNLTNKMKHGVISSVAKGEKMATLEISKASRLTKRVHRPHVYR